MSRSPGRSDFRTVPVLIDDVKKLDGFRMTRCTYFRIEASAAVIDFVAALRGRGIPFSIFGDTSVIDRPETRLPTFQTPTQLDGLFDQIEAVEGLIVETSMVWLPNSIFTRKPPLTDLPSDQDPSLERGEVWRISRELFRLALQFQREAIEVNRFLDACQELVQSEPAGLVHSPEETEVFRAWSASQIEAARTNFKEQVMDRGMALDWRDEYGEIHQVGKGGSK